MSKKVKKEKIDESNLEKQSSSKIETPINKQTKKTTDKWYTKSGIEKDKNISDKKVLVVKDLHVSFGKDKILQGVNFYLNRGETIAIVGKNGAGKTVMMETILGLINKDKGQINFDFFDKKEPLWKERKEIGMQFQDATVTKKIKGKHLLTFAKKIYCDKIDEKQIKEMIHIFGIKKILRKKIGKLSGGQKQRINLFLAVVHNPKLMILDEFITGLDIISVIDIIEYVKKIKVQNNASMIIISHQPEEIKSLADRILVLKDGQITSVTTPAEVKKNYESMIEFLVESM